MSIIKHFQIDIWNADCIGATDYYEFTASRPNVLYDSNFTNEEFHIMVDGGEIWNYNKIAPRVAMFSGRKLVM